MTRTGPGPVELTRLTEADVPAVAALHKRSFSGFFLAQLGEPFLREFYRGFLGDPSAIAIVAREPGSAAEPGRILGIAVGTVRPESFYGRLLKRRWYRFALAGAQAAARDPRVIRRLLRAVRYRGDAPSSVPGAALFASMCVEPDTAGRGVGSQLSDAWSGRAAELGATSAYLTTDRDGNDGVNRHHQRHGWRLESRYETPEGRRMNRYVKDLA